MATVFERQSFGSCARFRNQVVLLNYALGNGTCFGSARTILVTEVHRRATLSSVDARVTFCHFDYPSSWTAST